MRETLEMAVTPSSLAEAMIIESYSYPSTIKIFESDKFIARLQMYVEVVMSFSAGISLLHILICIFGYTSFVS